MRTLVCPGGNPHAIFRRHVQLYSLLTVPRHPNSSGTHPNMTLKRMASSRSHPPVWRLTHNSNISAFGCLKECELHQSPHGAAIFENVRGPIYTVSMSTEYGLWRRCAKIKNCVRREPHPAYESAQEFVRSERSCAKLTDHHGKHNDM